MEAYPQPSTPERPSSPGQKDVKTFIADKLKDAAETIRTKAESHVGDATHVPQYGNQAADWLEKASDSVRRFEPDRLKENVQREVHQNPGRSLVIAVAAGVALGVLFRRR